MCFEGSDAVFQDFWAAMSYLTRLPLPVKPHIQDLGRALVFFPLVGLVVGGVLAGVHWLLGGVLPPELMVAVILALSSGITGANLLTGAVLGAEGLMSAERSREDRLRAMRSGRAGPTGVVWMALLILVQFAALGSLHAVPQVHAIVLFPVLGRYAMVQAAYHAPYLSPEPGGLTVLTGRRGAEWTGAALVSLLLALSFAGLPGAVDFLAVALSTWLLAARFNRALGSLPGPALMAAGAVGETVALMLMAVVPA